MSGNSNEPGTSARSIASSGTPLPRRALRAPSSNRATISALNFAATIAKRPGGGVRLPSKVDMSLAFRSHSLDKFFHGPTRLTNDGTQSFRFEVSIMVRNSDEMRRIGVVHI